LHFVTAKDVKGGIGRSNVCHELLLGILSLFLHSYGVVDFRLLHFLLHRL